uniref:Uncharacterized protein n=1 Tax=Marmota marmota marmota TaxID=9994 RepID=A0A8C6ES22_MARMA
MTLVPFGNIINVDYWLFLNIHILLHSLRYLSSWLSQDCVLKEENLKE